MFKISDKVVCMTDFSDEGNKEWREKWGKHFDFLPEKGRVYVVRLTHNCLDINDKEITSIALVGIKTINNPDGQERMFHPGDFKLLHDIQRKKFDISGEYDYLDPNQ